MTIEEIKNAVDKKENVYWKSKNYKLIKDSLNRYLIHSQFNDHYFGLYPKAGNVEDYFIV